MHEKRAPDRALRRLRAVYTLPRLAEALREMYQSTTGGATRRRTSVTPTYVADEPLYVKTFRMRGDLVARHRPPARLLDVGCAAGFALTALRERGYDVRGVELSRPMAELARRRIGDEAAVHCGVLEESLFGGAKFDVITMFDVVEHVEDPVAFLATARRMLSPGGVVVFETQNVASRFARLMGVRWQHYKFQEHLWHFDPKTMRVLLAKAGLALVEWSPRRGGKHVSLRFLVERAGRVHPLLSDAARAAPALRRPLSSNLQRLAAELARLREGCPAVPVDELAARQFMELERVHWWFEGRRRVFFDVLARALAGRRDLAILDVGCGAGGMLGELRRFGEPAGLEISTGLLGAARSRGFPRLLVGSAEKLPVRAGRSTSSPPSTASNTSPTTSAPPRASSVRSSRAAAPSSRCRRGSSSTPRTTASRCTSAATGAARW
jgi:2-polyprenyl-3-methyl-5-hydroxy-6-metoxy-1,4-benzoquinol methylase